MRIWWENVNFDRNNGPNSFAQKLVKQLDKKGHSNSMKDISKRPDAMMCFIESRRENLSKAFGHDDIPLLLRLDGIYFNTRGDWKNQNTNIKRTYHGSQGIVFQSNFAKKVITHYFGEHPNTAVIQNGADIEYIDQIKPLEAPFLDKYEDIWTCCADWRPHKRLKDNVNYFLEYSGPNDLLVVAGKPPDDAPRHERVMYIGYVDPAQLYSLYKRSRYFIHLAWLDFCPNVVVDARACGCQVICTSSGGTPEIAGKNAIVIEQEPWDLKPMDLYDPPPLDFSKKIENKWDLGYDMESVAIKYEKFIESVV